MSVCSFDVGIKNLAYCIITKNNNEFTIIDWGIINIYKDKYENLKCCGTRISKEKKKKFNSEWKSNYMKNVKVTGKCYFDNCKINAKYKCIDQNLYCLKHKNEVIKKKIVEHSTINCGSKAKFYVNKKNELQGYCGVHKKKYVPFDDNWLDNYMKQVKTNNKCDYIFTKKQQKCGKNTKFKCEDGNYYCSSHKNICIAREIKKMSLQKIKKKKVHTD